MKEAPSLKGRVSLSSILDIIKIPFVALGNLFDRIFSKNSKKESKDDLSYVIDLSSDESEKKVQPSRDGLLYATHTNTTANEPIPADQAKAEELKDKAINELDNFASLIASLRAARDIDENTITPDKRVQRSVDYLREMGSLLVVLRFQIIELKDPDKIKNKVDELKDFLTNRFELKNEVEKYNASQSNKNLGKTRETAKSEAQKLFSSADNMRIAMARAKQTVEVNEELEQTFDRQLDSFNQLNGRFQANLNQLSEGEIKAQLDQLNSAYKLLEQTFNTAR